MNGIYEVTLPQLIGLMNMGDDALRIFRLSTRLFVGYHRGELVCAMGIIPPTLLSDEVYLWLTTTEALKSCKVAFGRYAQKFVKTILRLYPTIVGHCEGRSVKWLTHLGATIDPPVNGLSTFRITA